MAEGSTTESKIMCRYFVRGACRLGENCKYSHNRSDKQDGICKYYLKGCCVFADQCRYDHTKPVSIIKETFSDTSKCNKVRTPSLLEAETDSASILSLKKQPVKTMTSRSPKSLEEWVQAKEFVPGQQYICSSIPVSSSQFLCPFSTNEECPYRDVCSYVHREICDLCGLAVLQPGNTDQNKLHKKECIEQHEKDMELSFAIARSKDKQCGICMDIIMEKDPPTEQRFGILSDCTHCFCLACIRQWRASKQFDNKIVRSCPECRIHSNFVTPSMYWVDAKDDKLQLIAGYKQALSKKPCKYFDEGRGECAFNDGCFYLHMLPDGTKPPPQPHRRQRRHNANRELSPEQHIFLSNFFQERQERFESLWHLEFLDDEFALLFISLNYSSSDDSDNEY